MHYASTLADADRALRQVIPVTSVARTILDQAALLDERRLRKLLKRSEERQFFDLTAVHDVLARNKGHRGHAPLLRTLTLYEPPPFTRSDFEQRFYETVLADGLPAPRVNFETHGTRESFEEDRIRRARPGDARGRQTKRGKDAGSPARGAHISA